MHSVGKFSKGRLCKVRNLHDAVYEIWRNGEDRVTNDVQKRIPLYSPRYR